MRATYMLEAELDYNTWTDITADWHTGVPLIVERGIEPGERVARVGRMALALHNPDGRYTPGHANATPGFEAGIGVRLRATDGATARTLFYGRLVEIAPRRNAVGRDAASQAVAITVEDEVAALSRVRLDAFAPLFGVRPSEVANRLIDSSFTPPGLFTYWRLGHPQVSLLGTTTTLPGDTTGKSLDAGQSVFPWVGDTWTGLPSALDALRDVCASEGGYFAILADGTPRLWDRHARPKHTDPDATLSEALAALTADRSLGRVANRVQITIYPREVGDPAQVLWQSGRSILVRARKPQTVVAAYVDPAQMAAHIGAKDVIAPEAGLDYTATRHADGSGSDATGHIRLQAELGATSARLTLTNLHPKRRKLYVHNLRLRGTPLRSFEPAVIVLEDDDSRLAHGRQPLRLDLPLQDDPAVGLDMAGALLANRKDPHPWLTVEIEATASASLLAQALIRDVGDRLHVTDAALALEDAACFVESVRHEIARGGASHRVTWRTSPADLDAYWLTGQADYGELGESTRLGY